MRRFVILVVLFHLSIAGLAQSQQNETPRQFVDVFIYKNKQIRIESQMVELGQVSQEVLEQLKRESMGEKIAVTYRIFADSDLMLGYIMDVEKQLLKGYSKEARRDRLLLESLDFDIDGTNWQKRLEGLKFDTIKS